MPLNMEPFRKYNFMSIGLKTPGSAKVAADAASGRWTFKIDLVEVLFGNDRAQSAGAGGPSEVISTDRTGPH